MKTYGRCDDQFVSQEFGSEGLLLSLQTGQYYSLNHTAIAGTRFTEFPRPIAVGKCCAAFRRLGFRQPAKPVH